MSDNEFIPGQIPPKSIGYFEIKPGVNVKYASWS